jgi:hypothetical protein
MEDPWGPPRGIPHSDIPFYQSIKDEGLSLIPFSQALLFSFSHSIEQTIPIQPTSRAFHLQPSN